MEPIATDQSIVALCYNNREIGIACFDELTNSILCDTCSVSNDDMEDTLYNLKVALQPTLFLLHPKVITNKSLLELVLCGVDGTSNFYRFKTIKSSAWQSQKSQHVINECLVVKGHMSNKLMSGYQQLSCILNLEQDMSRQALGALLLYMQETVFRLDNGKVIVSSVKNFQQNTYMRIDKVSLDALQIFCEEVHPNVMKGKGRSKEGFSIFNLFDRTHSLAGRARLKEWMSRPFSDVVKIRYRQCGVALCVRQNNRDFVKEMGSLLRHFHDLPRLLLRVKKVEGTPLDWCKISISLATAQRILECIHCFLWKPTTDEDEKTYLLDVCSMLDLRAVQTITISFQAALCIEDMEANNEYCFIRGHDQVLDNMVDIYEGLEGYLLHAARDILRDTPLLEVLMMYIIIMFC
jgi:DNA mismatch repair ATPase MutS